MASEAGPKLQGLPPTVRLLCRGRRFNFDLSACYLYALLNVANFPKDTDQELSPEQKGDRPVLRDEEAYVVQCVAESNAQWYACWKRNGFPLASSGEGRPRTSQCALDSSGEGSYVV